VANDVEKSHRWQNRFLNLSDWWDGSWRLVTVFKKYLKVD